jgi:hypothetical protein
MKQKIEYQLKQTADLKKRHHEYLIHAVNDNDLDEMKRCLSMIHYSSARMSLLIDLLEWDDDKISEYVKQFRK